MAPIVILVMILAVVEVAGREPICERSAVGCSVVGAHMFLCVGTARLVHQKLLSEADALDEFAWRRQLRGAVDVATLVRCVRYGSLSEDVKRLVRDAALPRPARSESESTTAVSATVRTTVAGVPLAVPLFLSR